MKFLMWTGGIMTLVISTIYYYPTFLYLMLFLLYSIILIALGNDILHTKSLLLFIYLCAFIFSNLWNNLHSYINNIEETSSK